jgi:hypothetical protein
MSSAEMTLVSLYEKASPCVRRRGRAWYPEANRQLREIAERNNCPLSHAVAVFTIVSPAAQLVTALRWTDEILAGERIGGRYPNDQAPRIESACSTRYPVTRITGPKVNAFYRAIMGDREALVLDRWAIRAAGHPLPRSEVPRTLRRELDAAYRAAASMCGETVRAFQAIVWIVCRETTPTKAGRVPRLADVTT